MVLRYHLRSLLMRRRHVAECRADGRYRKLRREVSRSLHKVSMSAASQKGKNVRRTGTAVGRTPIRDFDFALAGVLVWDWEMSQVIRWTASRRRRHWAPAAGRRP